MSAHRVVHCTRPEWSVSVSTGSGIDGARLCVSHQPDGRHGDAHGRLFPSSDAAFAYAAGHGYTEAYARRSHYLRTYAETYPHASHKAWTVEQDRRYRALRHAIGMDGMHSRQAQACVVDIGRAAGVLEATS